MNNEAPTKLQNIGVAILALTIGTPALDYAGFQVLFGYHLDWSLPVCLVVATIGGAVGGALLADKHFVAGLMGGLLAGPGGFLALHFYVMDRESVRTIELVLAQLAGSLPGIGLYHILKRVPIAETPADEKELFLADERTA